MGCTQNPIRTKSHIWDFVRLYGIVFVIIVIVIIIIMIIKSEGCERTALEQILIRTPPPIIKQSHPGHSVHTGHPGFSVPVLHSVLQGRVYHRFGIFSFLMEAMTSEMRT